MNTTSSLQSSHPHPNMEKYDIPETKSLLPPLPEANLRTPTDLDDGFRFKQQNILTSTPPPITTATTANTNTSRRTHRNISSPMTPQLYDTPTSSHFLTPRSAFISPSSDPSSQHDAQFSPAISIDERFEVSLIEPENITIPESPQDRLKLFLSYQKKQHEEFEKTFSSMKKSGWMTDRELKLFEKSKRENWRKWDIKIEDLKREIAILKNSERLNKISNSMNYSNDNNSGYFSSTKTLEYGQDLSSVNSSTSTTISKIDQTSISKSQQERSNFSGLGIRTSGSV